MIDEVFQVKFLDNEANDPKGGIYFDNDGSPIIICACCGEVFPVVDVLWYKRYKTWVDFSEFIIDED